MMDSRTRRVRDEHGIALVVTMLVLMLMSALLIGFTSAVMGDQRFRYIDRDRVRAFYAAQAGLEKLSADLATLFFENVSPSVAEIADLADGVPSIDGVTFTTESGIAYGVTLLTGDDDDGEDWGTISTGPYEGLIALKKTYMLDSSVRTAGGGEAHLRREVDTVAIPVFQFGIFSDIDLSFHAGPNFNFGGRVHTNGNLFLAQGDGTTLTLPQKVTAVKEVIRGYLMNGVDVNTSNHQGTVRMARGTNTFRNLAETEGSVKGALGSATNEPAWTNLSLSAYNGYIRNGRTGAKTLNLPVVTLGGANVDIVRRPLAGEDVSDPTLLEERFYSKVSLRILLSDKAEDLTSLPGATAGAPVELDGDWTVSANRPAGYAWGDAAHPPVALSRGNTVATRTTTSGSNTTLTRLDVASIAPFAPTLTHAGSSLTCTTKTANATGATWTGCNRTMNVGDVITADDGTTSTISARSGSGTSATYTTDNNIVVKPLWVGNMLVSCSGWINTSGTPNRFTGCSGITSAPASNTVVSTASLSAAGVGTVGGFIKIEMQDANNVWHDVTMEILNHGFSGPNLDGQLCADPTPDAIIRIQRLRDNGGTNNFAPGCNYAGSTATTDHWPNVLFDQREALQRAGDPGAANLRLGGVMHYVTLDVANLSEWLAGTGVYNAGSGVNAKSVNGYSVYFSDRRNNRNLSNEETGEYGFEDVVNSASSSGTPDGVLEASDSYGNNGEDVNANGVLDSYGQYPSYKGTINTLPPGAGNNTGYANNFDAAGDVRPTTNITPAQARVNRAYLFRRALKLANGALGQIIAPGLTIVAENPVYVQGNWNANANGATGDPHVATAIIADAVTLLSTSWSDVRSFTSPYSNGGRPRAANSYYRFAVIAGKNAKFPRPSGSDTDFGTDGGTHNFLRMLEGDGNTTVHYRGSIATFYYSRQAVGTYKNGPYAAPTRNFNFDTEFLNPSLLPPLTPVFRDVNARGFTQEIRPGR